MTDNPPGHGSPAYEPPRRPPTPSGASSPAPLTPAEERQWGMLAHAIPLAAMVLTAGTLGFVASLVIYLMFKDRGSFVRRHAANSLNVQIITAIGVVVSVPLMLVLIGFLTYAAVFIFAAVVHIVGAIKANEGQVWSPPLTPRLVS